MRILYHHRTLADGAEGIHIASMIDALRELGHEVLLDGVRPRQGTGTRPRLISSIRSSLPQIAFELTTAAYDTAEYGRLRALISSYGAHLVYARHARFGTAAVRAAQQAGVPSVLEVNCLFTQEPYRHFEPITLRALATRMERQALSIATTVAAVSTPLARQITSLVDRAVLVTPNGADPVRFDPTRARCGQIRQRYGLADRFVVGWSGILRDWHGLDLLLAALEPLPSAMLLVVGDGPSRPVVEQRAQELGVVHRLVITGRVPHDVMPDYIAAMDVAVVAAERTGVASPMKLLEYMAMGRAVVAPRTDSIRDVIEEDVNGLLFSPGHAVELTAALSRLIGDSEVRRALGIAARRRIEQERNWQRIAKDILESVSDSSLGFRY